MFVSVIIDSYFALFHKRFVKYLVIRLRNNHLTQHFSNNVNKLINLGLTRFKCLYISTLSKNEHKL